MPSFSKVGSIPAFGMGVKVHCTEGPELQALIAYAASFQKDQHYLRTVLVLFRNSSISMAKVVGQRQGSLRGHHPGKTTAFRSQQTQVLK
jgi:hypothetical protein